MALLTSNPTVIHRAQFKSRPNLLSLDKGVLDSAVAADGSPSTSLSSTGKSSTALRVESTGKTSLDSKFSMNSKGISQHSSEHKKLAEKKLAEHGGSTENPLTSIAEIDLQDPEPVPSELLIFFSRSRVAERFSCCHGRKSRRSKDIL
jgi:protein-serine/threonine kinase